MVRSIRKMHPETDREGLYRRVLDFYALKRLTSNVRQSLDRVTSDAEFDLSEADALGSKLGDRQYATKRMSARVEAGHLIVVFEEGAQDLWELPDRSDKEGIRKVLNAAVEFALTNGVSPGQINAVRKALTDSDYHLTK